MRAIYLVLSPFQMLNAIEARHSLQSPDDECHLIYCRAISDRNAEQIRAMIEEKDWSSVTYVAAAESPETVPERQRVMEDAWKRVGPVDRFAVGHFGFPLGRHLANKFRPAEVIVLDDGTAAHRVYENRFEHHLPAGGEKELPWVKRTALFHWLKRWKSGIDARPFKEVTFFSIYKHKTHPCDRLVRNEFTYLRRGAPKVTDPARVYFLGGCLVELGIVSEKTYDRMLDAAAEMYRGREVTYIPHRREDSSRLERLRSRLGWKTEVLPVPVELFLLQADVLPSVLACTYSTALDSCFALFPESGMKIHAHVIPRASFLKEEDRKFSDQVYNYYRGYADERFCLWEVGAGEAVTQP